MPMLRKDALTIARVTLIRDGNNAAADTIQKMIDQLSKKCKPLTEEQRQARNATNRDHRAAKRRAEMMVVIPILRSAFSCFRVPITARELFMACSGNLPGYSVDKITYILNHDMSSELVRTEIGKREPYVYSLKGV